MKITIAYLPEEFREADLIHRFAQGLLDGAKVRKSDRHPPYKHIYLTAKKPETPCNSEENT
ncbi:hypothetical protein N510_001883 [Firmicutes bacterium ASF500]|nr:hypothetical protein N510_001883 [Firmicutes bacterium ASF500]